MKYVYAIQPYRVGAKGSRSLAIVIPSQVAKKLDIDTSTIFFLKMNEATKGIVLKSINPGEVE